MLEPGQSTYVLSASMVAILVIAGLWAEYTERDWARWPRVEFWCLRFAGCWLILWLTIPLLSAQTPAQNNQLTNQRVESLSERVGHLEELRIDARLSLLEEMKQRQVVMQQWMLGILGGVIVLVITQVFTLVQSNATRKERRYLE